MSKSLSIFEKFDLVDLAIAREKQIKAIQE